MQLYTQNTDHPMFFSHEKLGVHSRTEAMAKARILNILD
jgi:hypothetical protein